MAERGIIGTGNFLARDPSRVNQSLIDVLNEAAKQFPDYDVQVFSGYRPGDKRFHGKGMAADVKLIDRKTGKEVPNNKNAQSFRTYEKFAQTARNVQQSMYPELSKDFRWGGYFSGGKGKYGALDLMHFDLGGKRVGMGGGSWETGLTKEQRNLWPGAESIPISKTVTPGSTLLGKVLDGNGNQLVGPVFGSKQNYAFDPVAEVVAARNSVAPTGWAKSVLQDSFSPMASAPPVGFQPAPNVGRVSRMDLPAPQSIPTSYNPARSINPGAATPSGWADMAQANKAIPSAMVSPVVSRTPGPLEQTLNAASRLPASTNDMQFGAVQPQQNRMREYALDRFAERVGPQVQEISARNGLVGPVQAVTPIQATPTPGDTLIGPVANKAKDYATAQKAAQRTAAMPGMVSKIGGSLLGGALLGPVGGILGGLIGGYAAKNGLSQDAPLSINNIGGGANNVYGVYGGAARGTQANTNNGGMVTALGNGSTAYTNSKGVTSIQDQYGNNMADWSGRSYSKK